jgi:hypothetical protein
VSENEEQTEEVESGANYQALFVIGITFTGAGAALMITNPAMAGMMAMGIIFMIVGIANRDKWRVA